MAQFYPDAVADNSSVDRDTGHTIDWTNVLDTFKDATSGKKTIPPFTVMKLAANGIDLIPAAAAADTGVVGLLATPATQDAPSHALSGYGIIRGGVIYENLLPQATGTPKTLADGYKTSLNAAGTGFSFVQYVDNRS